MKNFKIIDFRIDSDLNHPDAESIYKSVSNGKDIEITIDLRIVPIYSSVCRPFTNWDRSPVQGGLITVLLSQGNFSGVAIKTKLAEGRDFHSGHRDYDTTGVSLRNLSSILWSSTINGQNPHINRVFTKYGDEVFLSSVFVTSDRVVDTTAVDGYIPVRVEGVCATTGLKITTNQYVHPDNVATLEYIKSFPGRERYVYLSWSSIYKEYITCNDGIVRPSHQCKPTIVDIRVDDNGEAVVDIEYTSLKYLVDNDYTKTIDRLVDNYDEIYILNSDVSRFVGNTYGELTPITYGYRFCLDARRKPITYRLEYHSGEREAAEEIKSGITIGFEVEKEDEEALVSYDANFLLSETGWYKERDGSLDDDSGYELVSPIYDLMSDKLDEDIKSNTELAKLINADYGRRCGGHIHLGNGDSGTLLFDKISPWIPLIYSLYVGRIGGEYCKIKKNDDIKNDHDKYQAVRIFDDRIEIRIISAVPNVDTLLWRRDLMRMIMNNLDWTPMKIVNQLLDSKSELYALLNKQYIPSQITVKARLYAYFASELLDDAHAVKQHIMNAVDHFSNTQIRHLKSYSFNVNK